MPTSVPAQAYLQAHGVDLPADDLDAALVRAMADISALYPVEPAGAELTEQELGVARAGGADVPDTGGHGLARDGDPLVDTVATYAALIKTGFRTQQAARLLEVSDARIRRRLGERSLLGVRCGGAWVLPHFQFHARRELPGWAEVCEALPASASIVALERWLKLPHPDLAVGQDEAATSPRDWLLAGRPPEAVVRLADELA